MRVNIDTREFKYMNNGRDPNPSDVGTWKFRLEAPDGRYLQTSKPFRGTYSDARKRVTRESRQVYGHLVAISAVLTV